MHKLLKLIQLLQTELLKVCVAGFGFAFFIGIDRLLGERYIVLNAFSQSLIVVLTSTFDKGLNTHNLNANFNGLILERASTKRFMPFIIILTSVITYYSWIFVEWQHWSEFVFLMLAIFFSTFFSVYIMRWNTICRREGLIKQQIIFGEIFPILSRASFVLLCTYLFNFVGFIVGLSLSYLLAFSILKTRVKVESLVLFSTNQAVDDRLPTKIFALSGLIALKNQLVGFVAPILPSSIQAQFVVFSRLTGLLSIMLSGIFARVPFSIKKIIMDKNFVPFKRYTAIVLGIIIVCNVFMVYWLELIIPLFKTDVSYSFLAQIQMLVLTLGLVVSYISMSLTSYGKGKKALISEVSYMVVFVAVIVFFNLSA
jgi:hypothetical protein